MELKHLSGTNPQANLIELCQKLRKEQLYTSSEKLLIKNLTNEVNNQVHSLFQQLWQTWHLQLNLLDLEVLTRTQYSDGSQSASVTPTAAQYKAQRLLQGLKFIPASDHFDRKENYEKIFFNFLINLRKETGLLAACLTYGNVLNLENSRNMVHTVMVTLYGNAIMSNSYHNVLEFLYSLAMLVFSGVGGQEPSKYFFKNTCTFRQAFRLFVDLMPKTKLFVTTAFHETIFQVSIIFYKNSWKI